MVDLSFSPAPTQCIFVDLVINNCWFTNYSLCSYVPETGKTYLWHVNLNLGHP